MAKTLHLTIPNACHEDWKTMTPEEKGRFCMACQKTVVDFTNMSDREILQHFSNTTGNVCGRMHPDQLNRRVVAPREPRLPWLKYFFQFTLPAVFVSMKTQAQDCKKPETVIVPKYKNDAAQLLPATLAESKFFVKGTVVNNSNEPIAFATVMIKGSNRGTTTDVHGNFSLPCEDENKITLVFSYVGYEMKELAVTPSAPGTLADIKMVEMQQALQGEVMIIVGYVNRKQKAPIRSPLEIARSIITPDSVRIFPNPVGLGNNIELQLKVNKPGKFYAEVSDFSGKLMLKKELPADAKSFQSAINTKQLLPGTYIVCVRNAEGKKIGVKKILVQ